MLNPTEKFLFSLETFVNIQDANLAQLIAYHPERDLQSIILANCNYSLEVGKGTKIEYEFAGMEKQIAERFVYGRPRLNFIVSSINLIDFQLLLSSF